ncbi:hypothetical protein K440DRAFT_360158 [Wilcoxina mikolae CBS 423.85]|nr:hypothetical protein K440DRAFT_360158 [Wilcoxina mikolae CBS 423.85]
MRQLMNLALLAEWESRAYCARGRPVVHESYVRAVITLTLPYAYKLVLSRVFTSASESYDSGSCPRSPFQWPFPFPAVPKVCTLRMDAGEYVCL